MSLSLLILGGVATLAFYGTVIHYTDQSLEVLISGLTLSLPEGDFRGNSSLISALPPDSFLGIYSMDGKLEFWSESPHPEPPSLSFLLGKEYPIPEVKSGNLHYRGHWFRFRSQVRKDPMEQQTLWLAGKSLQYLGDSLDRMQLVMGLVGMLAFGLSLLGGNRMARRALIPLDLVTQVASEISKDPNTRRRVASQHSQDQIGVLIHSFNTLLDRLQAAKKSC